MGPTDSHPAILQRLPRIFTTARSRGGHTQNGGTHSGAHSPVYSFLRITLFSGTSCSDIGPIRSFGTSSSRFQPARSSVGRLAPAQGWLQLSFLPSRCPHLELMGWEAARHHIVSVTFAMAVLSAPLRWRTAWPRACAVIVSAALGLFAGEAALSGLAYWIAYELTERRPLNERVLGIAPCIGTILVYLVVYTATHHGMHGGGSHIDPFDDPREFCRNIPRRALVMFVAVFSGAPLFPDRLHLVLPFLIGAVALVHQSRGCSASGGCYGGMSSVRRGRSRPNWAGIWGIAISSLQRLV